MQGVSGNIACWEEMVVCEVRRIKKDSAVIALSLSQ